MRLFRNMIIGQDSKKETQILRNVKNKKKLDVNFSSRAEEKII